MKLIKSINQLIEQFNYHRQHTDESVHPVATPKASGFASAEIAGNALHTKELKRVDNVFNTEGGEKGFTGLTTNNSPVKSGVCYLTTYKMGKAVMWFVYHSWTGSIFVANNHGSTGSPLPQNKWRSLTSSTSIVGKGNQPINLTNNTFNIRVTNIDAVNYKIIYGFDGNWNTITLTRDTFITGGVVNVPLNMIIPKQGGVTIRVSFNLNMQPNGKVTLSKNFIEEVSATGEVTQVLDSDNKFLISRVFEEYGQDQNINDLN